MKLGIETRGYTALTMDQSLFYDELEKIDHDIGYIKFVYPSIVWCLLDRKDAKETMFNFLYNYDVPKYGDEREKFILDWIKSYLKNLGEVGRHYFYLVTTDISSFFDDDKEWALKYLEFASSYLRTDFDVDTCCFDEEEKIRYYELILIENFFNECNQF